ncbi:HIT family protein [Ponticaulis sp.]|uniref:HIT family protein n=1 Tax=Ponticaulis sp. TaxID=2020902 RepID=UPI000B725151|nr:HIT family protein [Ponticaulis sp.]MAI89636.1 HIT family protein [Ponticaulis sp.]OUY00658.1 MAG: HIT family protein [Hyphomonadaceae bacterium TMED5]|tara:strand:- start:155449 stop:155883 length:435 start_codon:yes stop_codon:yes gene_type:complete
MSLHGTYEDDNIFAKIIKGEIPCVKVYEDDVALAFMDLFPQSEGHTLVIPKQAKARNLLEMPGNLLGSYMQRVQKVAKAVEAALKPDGIVVTQFNGAPAGQTVFHLHFHIIPRAEGESLKGHGTSGQADPAELEALAAKIRAEF